MSVSLQRSLLFSFIFLISLTPALASRIDNDTSTLPRSPDTDGRVTSDTSRAEADTNRPYTKEQQYLFDIFRSRRSVRRFMPTPIPYSHIITMLDIARSAPTSGNQQPWKFLVVQDRNKLNRLQEECVEFAVKNARRRGDTNSVSLDSLRQRRTRFLSNYLTAPLVIVVLTDSTSTYPTYNIYDGSLAAENLMIAARSLGYGSVFTTDVFPEEITKKAFEIPGQFQQICVMPIGVPEEWPDAPPKKTLGDFIVFEKFIEGNNYTAPVKRTAISLDRKTIDLVVGQYVIESGMTLAVTRDDDHILLQIPGQDKYEMFAESETKFFLTAINAQIQFTKNTEGKVTGLIVIQGGNKVPAKKIE
jgi:nitroreductase